MSKKKVVRKKNIAKSRVAVSLGKGYCRVCQKTLSLKPNFYEATNLNLDTNGHMSICKTCCNDLYDKYFAIHGDMETSINLVCMDLDMKFSEVALKQTQGHVTRMLEKGTKVKAVFGVYKSKLSTIARRTTNVSCYRYHESDNLGYLAPKAKIDIGGEKFSDELLLFWGEGFTQDDYVFLESELANWKKTHRCDNQAEITLLKEICIKILDIRKRRASGKATATAISELQALFRTASVDPAKANIASSGKSYDTWGMWIKEIEQFRPAEWHSKQEKYKDMDGFLPYIKDFIERPVINFISGNRDFKISDNIKTTLDDV